MIHWNDLPFIRITTAFIAGVWMHHFWQADSVAPGGLVIFAFLVSLIFFLLSGKRIIKKNFSSVLPILGFILLGWLSMHVAVVTERPTVESDILARQSHYMVEIESSPEKTARSVRYFGTVSQLRIDGKWMRVNKKVLLYGNHTTSSPWRYGDIVMIGGSLALLENAKNPHVFDYSLYLQRKGIYLSGFVNDYHHMGQIAVPTLRSVASRTGDFFDNLLSRYITSERELNMARAMILGRRIDMTPEMDFAYQATGTSHILSVSGLHVGIIYIVLASVLGFLKNGRSRWLHYGGILVALWAYTIVTGLSPSAQRAATMFSFVLIANLINRRSNIYNTLFGSAFILLIISPALIYSVSFQLSYLAVLGIVYLYNPIYGLMEVKNRVLNFFWKITAVSVAVQIAAFPVTIYYFHQFPALFAVTNLFAIPTATVVMIGGLVLLVVSSLTPVAAILGKFLTAWIYSFNEILVFFTNLDFNAIEGLQLRLPVVFLLLALTASLVRFIETRELVFFRYVTLIFCFTLGFWIIDMIQTSNQRQVTFYSMRSGTTYDIFIGRTCYSNSSNTVEDVAFNLSPNREYHRIREIKHLNKLAHAHTSESVDLFVLQGKTFLVLKQKPPRHYSLPIHIDYLILSHKDEVPPDGLVADFIVHETTKPITYPILPGKNPVIFHSVRSDGALEVSF